MSYLEHNGISKSINVLCIFFCMGVFCTVLLFKMEAWAKKQKTETLIEITQLEWDSSLYRKKVFQDNDS